MSCVDREQALKAITKIGLAHGGKGMPERTARAAVQECVEAVTALQEFPCGDVPTGTDAENTEMEIPGED